LQRQRRAFQRKGNDVGLMTWDSGLAVAMAMLAGRQNLSNGLPDKLGFKGNAFFVLTTLTIIFGLNKRKLANWRDSARPRGGGLEGGFARLSDRES
jgi:hypothetical protein